MAHKWKELAILLEFDEAGHRIKNIECDHAIHGVERCCTEAFILWLQGKGKEQPTWEGLIRCLEDIEQGTLAQELRDKISGMHRVTKSLTR